MMKIGVGGSKSLEETSNVKTWIETRDWRWGVHGDATGGENDGDMMLLVKEKEKMGGVLSDGAMCAEKAQLQELKLQ